MGKCKGCSQEEYKDTGWCVNCHNRLDWESDCMREQGGFD